MRRLNPEFRQELRRAIADGLVPPSLRKFAADVVCAPKGIAFETELRRVTQLAALINFDGSRVTLPIDEAGR